jgi:hypothetical protein
MRNEVYKRKGEIRHELPAHILDPAARIKKFEAQLERRNRDLRTGVAKCVEAEEMGFENLL